MRGLRRGKGNGQAGKAGGFKLRTSLALEAVCAKSAHIGRDPDSPELDSRF